MMSLIICLGFTVMSNYYNMSKCSQFLSLSRRLHTGPALWMSLWEVLYKMCLNSPNYLQWPWICHEVRLRNKGDQWVETEQRSSVREEMMAESILSVSTAKHNASSVRGGPLSQASLKQTPVPACSKHIPSVCKHRDHDQNPWGTQTYGTWF